MPEAVIVSPLRTAVGKAPRGMLRSTRPDDMAATVIRATLERTPELLPYEIDDVILGCAMPEAEQGMNLARIAALRAGLPDSVPGMTINRFCSSGLQSIALAAERIRGGGAEVIFAGGAESMSLMPRAGHKLAPNPWLVEWLPQTYISMGLTAEKVMAKYGISREQADAFSLGSHQKALAAQQEGRFRRRDRAARHRVCRAGQWQVSDAANPLRRRMKAYAPTRAWTSWPRSSRCFMRAAW